MQTIFKKMEKINMSDKVIETSKKFWTAMENVDADEMRNIAEENASFVHIGVTVELGR
jgi:hypothetical protein